MSFFGSDSKSSAKSSQIGGSDNANVVGTGAIFNSGKGKANWTVISLVIAGTLLFALMLLRKRKK